MAHIPPCPPRDADPVVRAVYEEFDARMGFDSAPNFIQTQGHSAAVARGTWDLVRNILVQGDVPRWIKEVIFVAISHDRRGGAAALVACCRMTRLTPEWMDAAARGPEGIPDPKLRNIVAFAVKCARDARSLSGEDYAALRAHGLTEGEIVEIVAMSALAVYASIIADATAMEEDAAP